MILYNLKSIVPQISKLHVHLFIPIITAGKYTTNLISKCKNKVFIIFKSNQ